MGRWSRSRSGARERRRRSYSHGNRRGEAGNRLDLAEIKALVADLERKAKLGETKFSRVGTEKNIKFAEEVRKAYSTDMRSVLRRIFGADGIPRAITDQLAVGDKLIDDRIVLMKVAIEFGWSSCAEFDKEEIARNEAEEKKIKRLRKAQTAQKDRERDKKEREEAAKKRKAGDGGGGRDRFSRSTVCYRCNKTGHIAHNCYGIL